MADYPALLAQLARRAGIETHWRDIWGVARTTSDDSLAALLEAMGYPASTAAIAQDTLRNETARNRLPPVIVVEAAKRAPLPQGATTARAWQVTLEDGRQFGGTAQSGTRTTPIALPAGYHRLECRLRDGDRHMTIIATPGVCHLPPTRNDGRIWGVMTQLYALHNERSWGIGDFTALGHMAAGAARQGARMIGINPLHALFPTEPDRASPYSPSSRLHLNPLYIDIEAVPDVADCVEVQELLASPAFQDRLRQARGGPLVDYAAVSALKTEMFGRLWQSFRDHHLADVTSARAQAFRRFQADGGRRLRDFACFQALQAQQAPEDADWHRWPSQYQSPDTIDDFAEYHHDAIEAIQYLQWEADRQLGGAAQSGAKAGLTQGLYRDLAIGADPNGADPWSQPACFITGATVGAPPDLMNFQGQNWGLTSYRPTALRAQAYAPFIATLRANMRHAGALRIDHVMGLKRLYLIPSGASAVDGAYVSFPFRDLLGVLALESQRHRCLVVGEDLGTVPNGFRSKMSRANVLSCRVLMFERDSTGDFKRPAAYPKLATASIGTHDIPPLKAWWQSHDIELRHRLGMQADGVTLEDEHRRRAEERQRLIAALLDRRVLTADQAALLQPHDAMPACPHFFVEAIHRYLAQSSSRLILVQPEDILSVCDMTNLPGTFNEHPNWRRRLPVPVAALLKDERFRAIAAALRGVMHD